MFMRYVGDAVGHQRTSYRPGAAHSMSPTASARDDHHPFDSNSGSDDDESVQPGPFSRASSAMEDLEEDAFAEEIDEAQEEANERDALEDEERDYNYVHSSDEDDEDDEEDGHSEGDEGDNGTQDAEDEEEDEDNEDEDEDEDEDGGGSVGHADGEPADAHGGDEDAVALPDLGPEDGEDSVTADELLYESTGYGNL